MKLSVKTILREIDLGISIFCLGFLVLITLYGVIMRYFINRPLIWLEECQMFLIIWTVFFGGSAAFRYKNHVAIEILVDIFNPKIQKIIYRITAVIILFILLFLAYYGCLIIKQYSSLKRVTDILKIPYAFIYSAVPIGSVFMLVNFLVSIREMFPRLRMRYAGSYQPKTGTSEEGNKGEYDD